MKKYGKVLMVGIVTFFASISAVSAKEKVKISDLLKEAESLNPQIRDVYVVGDYAFTSNHQMTSQDIMLASRSIDVKDKTGKINTDDIYQEMVMQHFSRKKTGSNSYSAWEIVDPKIGKTEKKETNLENEVSVRYIDYKLATSNGKAADVEEKLKEETKKLNEKVSDSGFNKITYENHVLTFDILDITKKLAEYNGKEEIIKLFDEIVKDTYGFESISYTINGNTVTKNKNEVNNNGAQLAAEMLKKLAGKDSASDLTYLDVANRTAKATVTYKDEYGTQTVEYTLKFVYDIKTEKDKALKSAANELNGKAKEYGFKSVSYESETAIFEIEDTTKKLVEFSASGILDMFDKYIAGATKIEYTVGNTPVLIDKVDSSKKTEYAAQLLCLMANDGDNNACSSETLHSSAIQLTLGDVANKSAKAKFTYTIGDETEEISYTLKFNYDLETVKNDAIKADIDALSKIINADNEAFSSVEYKEDTHTVTFTVKNQEKTMYDLGVSGITQFNKMFNEFVKDAESITYKVGDQDVTVGNDNAVTIAKALLCTMANKENTNCSMSNIKLSDLSGKSASATVKYKVGGKSITYTVKFESDPAAQASMLKFNSNNKAFRLN